MQNIRHTFHYIYFDKTIIIENKNIKIRVFRQYPAIDRNSNTIFLLKHNTKHCCCITAVSYTRKLLQNLL